jgi:hypothetical protein
MPQDAQLAIITAYQFAEACSGLRSVCSYSSLRRIRLTSKFDAVSEPNSIRDDVSGHIITPIRE